ncbi:hypothetical protein [Montanilutibacter psychrotolerans]|uniref:Uncharacterized protein n=1 Tax=Montanilutibacter psychrotolerans TaxID=1327343 RepID=A0A3M8SW63_9GAMM|nr:hypothetical protein [Lysobacter psychrotolerans]RNF83696.1 hypothetical protein EER27_09965 [Lysobacter psychrotolerans]
MTLHNEQLRNELVRTEATMVQVIRRAGHGVNPGFSRRLDQHSRALRSLLDDEGAAAASEAISAAKRAMEAADPAAPLLMLAMAREQLTLRVRRHLSRAGRRRAVSADAG